MTTSFQERFASKASVVARDGSIQPLESDHASLRRNDFALSNAFRHGMRRHTTTNVVHFKKESPPCRTRTSPARLPPLARSPTLSPQSTSSIDLLAYSKKPRDVEFEPHRTPIKKQQYKRLGGLGPDLENEDLLRRV